MKEKVEPVMFIVDLAEKAMKQLGIKPLIKPIRGGTDGCRLSYMGLPCPNIFAGGHNFHGEYEYVPVESMQKAIQVIVKIAELTASTDFTAKKIEENKQKKKKKQLEASDKKYIQDKTNSWCSELETSEAIIIKTELIKTSKWK